MFVWMTNYWLKWWNDFWVVCGFCREQFCNVKTRVKQMNEKRLLILLGLRLKWRTTVWDTTILVVQLFIGWMKSALSLRTRICSLESFWISCPFKCGGEGDNHFCTDYCVSFSSITWKYGGIRTITAGNFAANWGKTKLTTQFISNFGAPHIQCLSFKPIAKCFDSDYFRQSFENYPM